MPGQHGQQYRPQHIPLLWCVRTHVLQWTLLHPLVEQPASFQKFDEKWHLAQIAHRRFRNPFHLDLTGKSVHASVVFRHYVAPQNSLTLWVSLHNHFFLAHAPQYPLFTFSPNSRTAFFKMKDDGTLPTSGPFANGYRPEIYATGFRDPHALLPIPGTGDFWEVEHGDELNLVKAGGNYGWPFVTSGDGEPIGPPPAGSNMTGPYVKQWPVF